MVAGTWAPIGAARKMGLIAWMVGAALVLLLIAPRPAAAVVVNDHTPTCRSVAAAPTAAPLLDGLERPAARNLVPVWAMVEGGKPIVNGRVQLYAGSGAKRRLLAVTDADRSTSSQGVVVLHPRRIPGDLTAVVRGGRVEGKRFRGSMKTRVSGYRSGDVLTVNPVTTIATAYRLAHSSKGGRKAVRRVMRYLRIPAFHDIWVDLRRSDIYFDGDVLLDRLAGQSMDELARKVVKRMDRTGRGGSDRFVAVSPRSSQRAALGDAEEIGGAFIAKNLLSGVLSAAGGQVENAALGFVLSSLGLGGGGDGAALAAIQAQLNEITAQLTDLEAGVSEIEAELSSDELKTLIAAADSDQSAVDGGENCLSFLLAMTPGDPDIKVLTANLTSYIGSKLLPLEDDFANRLSGSEGLIQASYEATLANARVQTSPTYPFWTQADGDQPRSLLDYYAAYQAQLGMFTAEYDHVQGLEASVVTANVQSFNEDVTAEVSALKAGVPDGTVVDTNTGLIWSQSSGLPCEGNYPGEVFLWDPMVNGVPISKELPCGGTASFNTFSFFDVGPQSGRDPDGNTVQLDHLEPPFPLTYGGQASPFKLRTAKALEIKAVSSPWSGRSSSPANFLATHAGMDMTQPIVWLDESGEPMCAKNAYPFGDVCFALDLSVPGDNQNIAFLDYDKPDAPQAAILWAADAPAGTFWFTG